MIVGDKVSNNGIYMENSLIRAHDEHSSLHFASATATT